MPRKTPPKLADLQPGDKVSGYVHICPRCNQMFVARKDAVVCSNACRVALSRESRE